MVWDKLEDNRVFKDENVGMVISNTIFFNNNKSKKFILKTTN